MDGEILRWFTFEFSATDGTHPSVVKLRGLITFLLGAVPCIPWLSLSKAGTTECTEGTEQGGKYTALSFHVNHR